MSQPLQIDILSVHISSQPRPEDQSLSLGMQSMHECQLESKIKNLKLKLEKKDQLIKFLEKKCGNQIIKCSKKLQQKIKNLQTQNSNLKNTLELFTLHNDKLQKNILFNKPSEQNSNLETTASNIGTQEETFRENKNKLFYQFKQDLINLSDEQLKQIILIQSFELKKIWKENEINGFLLVKSKTKEKKHGFHAKKNSLVLSLSESTNRDSNENLNKLNLHSLALKDTTNLNLNIGSPRQFNKKSSHGLSYRAVPQLISIQTQTQKEEIKTKQEQIQTCNAQLTEISCQTEISMNKIQQMENNIINISKNEKQLKGQVSDLKSQNASLKEQISFFSVKIQEYCHQLQKQEHMDVDNEIIPNNSPDYQTYITLLDNYIQVLQIFDIQPLIEPLSRQNQEKTHKRLINQICGMKLQISQVIKQFKRLERQLHESFIQRNQLLGDVKWQAQRIMILEHQSVQLNELLKNSNEQIMNLTNKDLHWRMLRKYEQLEMKLPQTKLKQKYKKPLTDRKQESTKSEVILSTKSQEQISIGQANEEDYNLLLENEKILENTPYQIENVEALYV